MAPLAAVERSDRNAGSFARRVKRRLVWLTPTSLACAGAAILANAPGPLFSQHPGEMALSAAGILMGGVAGTVGLHRTRTDAHQSGSIDIATAKPDSAQPAVSEPVFAQPQPAAAPVAEPTVSAIPTAIAPARARLSFRFDQVSAILAAMALIAVAYQLATENLPRIQVDVLLAAIPGYVIVRLILKSRSPQAQTGGVPTAGTARVDSAATGWRATASLAVAVNVVAVYVIAGGTAFNHAHRASAALVALLAIIGLALLAQAALAAYQTQLEIPAGSRDFGLKAAVIGEDGRASTSKTHVVLWTGAIFWALSDLLLLARAYPGGGLFTDALGKYWRPEYFVLLGIPVGAAAFAKAVVAGSNKGMGPVAGNEAKSSALARVYVRDRATTKGLLAGIAELLTGDDNKVDWADLQYVVINLIALAYFVTQFLARPEDGLPAIPTTLLALMGVSGAGYTANKVVQVRGKALPPAAGNLADGQQPAVQNGQAAPDTAALAG